MSRNKKKFSDFLIKIAVSDCQGETWSKNRFVLSDDTFPFLERIFICQMQVALEKYFGFFLIRKWGTNKNLTDSGFYWCNQYFGDNFSFWEKIPISQITKSTASKNVFCVFLNKEIRYWCNLNWFRVQLMWPTFFIYRTSIKKHFSYYWWV